MKVTNFIVIFTTLTSLICLTVITSTEQADINEHWSDIFAKKESTKLDEQAINATLKLRIAANESFQKSAELSEINGDDSELRWSSSNQIPPANPNFEAAFQGECDHSKQNNHNPCEHVCLDLHDGTYECSCFYGFTLAVDGYSCTKLSSQTSFYSALTNQNSTQKLTTIKSRNKKPEFIFKNISPNSTMTTPATPILPQKKSQRDSENSNNNNELIDNADRLDGMALQSLHNTKSSGVESNKQTVSSQFQDQTTNRGSAPTKDRKLADENELELREARQNNRAMALQTDAKATFRSKPMASSVRRFVEANLRLRDQKQVRYELESTTLASGDGAKIKLSQSRRESRDEIGPHGNDHRLLSKPATIELANANLLADNQEANKESKIAVTSQTSSGAKQTEAGESANEGNKLDAGDSSQDDEYEANGRDDNDEDGKWSKYDTDQLNTNLNEIGEHDSSKQNDEEATMIDFEPPAQNQPTMESIKSPTSANNHNQEDPRAPTRQSSRATGQPKRRRQRQRLGVTSRKVAAIDNQDDDQNNGSESRLAKALRQPQMIESVVSDGSERFGQDQDGQSGEGQLKPSRAEHRAENDNEKEDELDEMVDEDDDDRDGDGEENEKRAIHYDLSVLESLVGKTMGDYYAGLNLVNGRDLPIHPVWGA